MIIPLECSQILFYHKLLKHNVSICFVAFCILNNMNDSHYHGTIASWLVSYKWSCDQVVIYLKRNTVNLSIQLCWERMKLILFAYAYILS